VTEFYRDGFKACDGLARHVNAYTIAGKDRYSGSHRYAVPFAFFWM
jgi:hypothetical protein